MGDHIVGSLQSLRLCFHDSFIHVPIANYAVANDKSSLMSTSWVILFMWLSVPLLWCILSDGYYYRYKNLHLLCPLRCVKAHASTSDLLVWFSNHCLSSQTPKILTSPQESVYIFTLVYLSFNTKEMVRYTTWNIARWNFPFPLSFMATPKCD